MGISASGCARLPAPGTATTDAGPREGDARLDRPGADRGDTGDARMSVDALADVAPHVLTDFPVDPLFDGDDVPRSAPAWFMAPERPGAAPCITEPRRGTLLPSNWLRPLVAYRAPSTSDDLFEVTLSTARFAHSLRIYTRRKELLLDEKIWKDLRTTVNDELVSVGVRGLTSTTGGTAGPSPTATTTFIVAPVQAPGAIVYWAVTQTQGSLKGFSVGDEMVHDVLTAPQVEARTSSEICIGCHASTPDGQAVGFALGMGFYYDSIADLTEERLGRVPTYVTSSALEAVRKLLGVPAYSPAHWSDGDRVTVLADDEGRLHWVQLDGDRRGVIERQGDGRQAAEPAFRHDGTSLAYVANDSFAIGRANVGPTDIFEVPYNEGRGGPARAMVGASDPAFSEFYPAYSADDRFLAFSRVAGADNLYSNPLAEIAVIDTLSSSVVRLDANDAPTCLTELASPGLTNDWPKWAPEVGLAPDGRRFYWLTFSSARTGKAQIYLTALVVEPGKAPRSTPAVWFWNQGQDAGNHTPAWDVFRIPTPG